MENKELADEIIQSMIGMTRVNCYLAYKYLTQHAPTLWDFTNRVALAMCAVDEQVEEREVADGTRLSRKLAEGKRASVSDPGGLSHRLFSARTLGVGGKNSEGYCKICNDKHASGICKTCSSCDDKPKPFLLCNPGKHG